MNKGLYHPVLNPEGTSRDVLGADALNTTFSFTTKEDCFDPAKVDLNSGTSPTNSPRPDGLYFGAINEKVIHRKKVINNSLKEITTLIQNGEFSNVFDSGYQKINKGSVSVSSDKIVGKGGLHTLTHNVNIGNAYKLYKDEHGKIYAPDGFVVDTANVYQQSGIVTSLLDTTVANDASISDEYSTRISTNGSRMVVGAPEWDASQNNQGGVYTYSWNGSSWTQVGSVLQSPEIAADQRFGLGVSISDDGNKLVVGSLANKIWVFTWNGSGWTYTGLSKTGSNFFGWDVDISGDGTVIAVGEPFSDVGGTDFGKVNLLREVAGQWNLSFNYWAYSPRSSDDEWGQALAASSNGNLIVVGGSEDDGNSITIRGGIRIYNGWGSGAGNIITAGQQEITGPTSDEWFGFSVGVNGVGNRIIVGSPNYNNSNGRIRIYNWNGSSASLVVDKANDMPGTTPDYGSAVAISNDIGGVYYYAVGGSGAYTEGKVANGSVNIYASNSGTAFQSLHGEFGIDYFGSSLAMTPDAKYLVVGAPGKDKGKVYFYEKVGANYIPSRQNIEPNVYDNFGGRVAISDDGNTIIVRAFQSGPYIYVYFWDGVQWVQTQSPLTSNGNSNSTSRWGTGFDMWAEAGDSTYPYRVIFGDPGDDNGVQDGGRIDYFRVSTSNILSVFSEVNHTNVGDAFINQAYFGKAVSLNSDGTKLAANYRVNSNDNAIVNLSWNGSTWSQRGPILKTPNPGTFDDFGADVAISSDGNNLIVGVPDSNPEFAILYKWSNTASNWYEATRFFDEDAPSILGNFGSSVDIFPSGDKVIIGELSAGSAEKVYTFGTSVETTFTSTSISFPYIPAIGEELVVYGSMSNNVNIMSLNDVNDSEIVEFSDKVIGNSDEISQIISAPKDSTKLIKESAKSIIEIEE